MASREELMTALRNAHDAGDTEAATRIAAMVPSASAPAASTALPKTRSAFEYAKETVGNIPSSAGRLVSDVASAVAHPIDTLTNVGDVAAGGLRRALPQSVSSAIDKLGGVTPEQITNMDQKSDAVGRAHV